MQASDWSFMCATHATPQQVSSFYPFSALPSTILCTLWTDPSLFFFLLAFSLLDLTPSRNLLCPISPALLADCTASLLTSSIITVTWWFLLNYSLACMKDSSRLPWWTSWWLRIWFLFPNKSLRLLWKKAKMNKCFSPVPLSTCVFWCPESESQMAAQLQTHLFTLFLPMKLKRWIWPRLKEILLSRYFWQLTWYFGRISPSPVAIRIF